MHIKRSLCLLLSIAQLLLIFSITGCVDKKNTDPSTTSVTAAARQPVGFGASVQVLPDPAVQARLDAMYAAAAQTSGADAAEELQAWLAYGNWNSPITADDLCDAVQAVVCGCDGSAPIACADVLAAADVAADPGDGVTFSDTSQILSYLLGGYMGQVVSMNTDALITLAPGCDLAASVPGDGSYMSAVALSQLLGYGFLRAADVPDDSAADVSGSALCGMLVSICGRLGAGAPAAFDPAAADSFLSQFGGVSVSYINLFTGEFYSYDGGDTGYYAASTIKAPFAWYICSQIVSGQADPDSTIQYTRAYSQYTDSEIESEKIPYGTELTLAQLLHFMIVYSDNVALYMLASEFDVDGFDAFLAAQGIDTSTIYGINTSYESSDFCAQVMRKIYGFLTRNSADQYAQAFEDDLKHTDVNYFSLSEPVIGKYGWWLQNLHQIGIVCDASPYVLTVMTSDGGNGTDSTRGAGVIARIAAYFDAQNKARYDVMITG